MILFYICMYLKNANSQHTVRAIQWSTFQQLGQYCYFTFRCRVPRGVFTIEFSLLCTKQWRWKKNGTNNNNNEKIHSLSASIRKQNQVFRHSQAISVRPILEKPMWFYNGRNQFIPMKISFTTNFIGMIRMQMKRITSKFLCFFPFPPTSRFALIANPVIASYY